MNPSNLLYLLQRVQKGEATPEQAMESLRHLPYEDLGMARVDHHRHLRHGFPEVIFGRGKTPSQVGEIAQAILRQSPSLLITHATVEMYEHVLRLAPEARYHETGHCITHSAPEARPGSGDILIVTAGTSDLPVAEEARITAEIAGNRVELVADVGVAGIHRLLGIRERLTRARVIIAVAGMEGALPSAIGGLASCPVIAVPTSVGYGASFGGVAALLGMLNSCASNVTVVNIDNGFGAGYVASLINQMNTAPA